MIEEYVLNNPCSKVRWVRGEKTVIEAFTNEEVAKMLKVYKSNSFLDIRNRTIIAVLSDTGIRNAELCDIRPEDIKGNKILIHGKGNKERYVPITPALNKYLIKYSRIRDSYVKDKFHAEDFYFVSYRSKKLTVEAIERVVKLAGETVGVRDEIRCSPHTFRHYYAQVQLSNGLDVYSLSRLLGHENIGITKRYLQSMSDDDIVLKAVGSSPLMNI